MSIRTRTRHLRRSLLSVVLLLTVTLLAACANPVPEAEPEAASVVPPPALTAAQSTRILDAVGAVLSTSDANLDASTLSERLTGPALAIRSAEYIRSQATSGERTPTSIPTTAQTTIVPDTDTWPRTQMVVTEQPDDLQAPLLLVLVQESAREPYQLWGWARLGQSVEMPATAEVDEGSEPVAADDTSLLLSPTDALAQYADVLTNGDSSAYAATFPTDFFRTALTEARAQTVSSLEAVASVTETVAPVADQVYALRTVDGGAIVVGQLTTVTTATLSQGSITLSDAFDAALAGKTSVTSNLVRTWTDVVAMYVPPAGSTAQVEVLAAEHARTSVTGE